MTFTQGRSWWTAFWNQWMTEFRLRRRGLKFRSTVPNVVASSYDAMTVEEFDAINARQEWANWRILPSILKEHLPDAPLQVVDLGSGTGASTQALAKCCPDGSRILAIERSPRLLRQALARDYRTRGGTRAAVHFSHQSIAQTWRDGGTIVANGSIDLVVSCGVLGHHFTHATVKPVLSELKRVLHPHGIACLDVGPELSDRELIQVMSPLGLRPIAGGRSCLLDRNRQIVFRSDSIPETPFPANGENAHREYSGAHRRSDIFDQVEPANIGK